MPKISGKLKSNPNKTNNLIYIMIYFQGAIYFFTPPYLKSWNRPWIYIHFACLSVCPFVSNKLQNDWTDRNRNLCGTSHDLMQRCSELQKRPHSRIYNQWRHIRFLSIYLRRRHFPYIIEIINNPINFSIDYFFVYVWGDYEITLHFL